MAFFTRKGLTVPEFPSDCVLPEEPEEFHLPSTPSSLATSTPDEISAAKTINDVNSDFDAITTTHTASISVQLEKENTIDVNANETTKSNESDPNGNKEPPRFEYVVDHIYGVEV